MKRSWFGQYCGCVLIGLTVGLGTSGDLFAQNNSERQPVSNSAPKGGYTISKETTYFTGPLKSDGTIDFVAAVNEHFAKGVTNENNAARVIVPLLDPENWGRDNSARRDQVLQSLGLDPAQHPGSLAFNDFSYLRDSQLGDQRLSNEYNVGLERPWTDDEFPSLLDFLSDNQEALAQISAAVGKDRYFVPFTVDGDSDSLVAILLEHLQASRSLARAYAIRANNHLANHRWQQAWDDILTIKELGRLIGQGPTLIEGLVGVALTRIASKSATLFIATADPKQVDWESLQESWETRPIANIGEKLGNSERAMFIQLTCQIWDRPKETFLGMVLHESGENELAGLVPDKLFAQTLRGMLTSAEVNLDDALRFANQMYDRAIEIIEMPDADERNAAFEELEKKVAPPQANGDQSPLFQVFFAKPQDPTEQFSKVLLAMIFPSTQVVARAEWATEATQHVVELALAARVLQSQTGHLPGSLRELEPLVAERMMIQPTTGEPIAFRADRDGILIYHWNTDCVDNGGDIDGENPKDWGIRIEK